MVVRVCKRRRILKRMCCPPQPQRLECDIIYCENVGLSGFPCEHRVCGSCMVKLIHIVQSGPTYEYFIDCPCCRHQYSVSESIVKRLVHEFSVDHVIENVRCGCKSCNMCYVVKLVPCLNGCICGESKLSHSVYYNVDSESEPDIDSDEESYNVCFLDENGDADRMQSMLSNHVH
jgi:hypothetical protein